MDKNVPRSFSLVHYIFVPTDMFPVMLCTTQCAAIYIATNTSLYCTAHAIPSNCML